MEDNTTHIPRDERGEQIDRDELEAGDTVIVEWSPYQWWSDHTGISGRTVMRVIDGPDFTGDVRLKVNDIILRDYGEGRRYVSGPSYEEDMPERTDVGMGARYYRYE